MQVPESLHHTDALRGLAVGSLATGITLLATARRPWWTRAAALVAAAVAGVVAMFAARGVRRRLIDDVTTGAAVGVVVVGLLAGLGWSKLTRSLSDRELTVVVMTSAAGVWAAVPDTETSAALIAALTPFAIWSLVAGSALTDPATESDPATETDPAREPDPPRDAAWLTASFCLVAVVLAWAAAWGASARHASLPGAFSCFGLALLAFVPTPSLRSRRRPRSIGLVVIHLLVVGCASRWAAFAVTVGGGILRSAIVLVVGAIAVVLLDALSDRGREPEHRRPSDPAARPR